MKEYEICLTFIYHVEAENEIDAVEQAELWFKEETHPLADDVTVEEVSES